MSSLTNFLKLFKWDTKTDSSQKFNIDKALNENIDKIEANAVEVNQALSTKMNLHRDTKALTKKGWYRVAEFVNTGIYIVNITQRYNNMRPSNFLLLVEIGSNKFNISILDSSTCYDDGNLGISQARIVKDVNSANASAFLEFYYNYNVSNNITVQIINESINTNVNTIHFTETTSEDIFIKATKDMKILHLDDAINTNKTAIGILSSLKTTEKTSLVTALNELYNNTYGKMRYYYTSTLQDTIDNIMNYGYSSVCKVGGNDTIAKGAGFPTGAYKYGVLITLYHAVDYANVQIYIPDGAHTRGIYVRNRTGGNWAHFQGESVACIKEQEA